jgi:tartrate-resistant acid phosphatase type 5
MAKITFIAFIVIISCSSCSKYNPCKHEIELQEKPRKISATSLERLPKISFYALGDQGDGSLQQKSVAQLMAKDLLNLSKSELESKPFVLGLGDNLYQSVWPRGWEKRKEAKYLLEETFSSVYSDLKFKDQPLDFYMTPGNHDHDGDILQLEITAEGLFNAENKSELFFHYTPSVDPDVPDTNDQAEYHELSKLGTDKISFPEELSISSNLVQIISLDTFLLLMLYQDGNKEAINQHWNQLEKLIQKRKNVRWRFIIGHHPVISYGRHAEPLTVIQKLKIFFWGGYLNDQDNPFYRKFSHTLKNILDKHQVDFYLSGHDHNLQFIGLSGGSYQVISGGGSSASSVASCADTIFAKKSLGFVRFDIWENLAILKFSYLQGQNEKEKIFQVDKKKFSDKELN